MVTGTEAIILGRHVIGLTPSSCDARGEGLISPSAGEREVLPEATPVRGIWTWDCDTTARAASIHPRRPPCNPSRKGLRGRRWEGGSRLATWGQRGCRRAEGLPGGNASMPGALGGRRSGPQQTPGKSSRYRHVISPLGDGRVAGEEVSRLARTGAPGHSSPREGAGLRPQHPSPLPPGLAGCPSPAPELRGLFWRVPVS